MGIKNVKIRIAGIPYTIATDTSPEYVEELADKIETRIRSITAAARHVSPAQAEALVLLEYADEIEKASQEAETLRARLKEYLADAAQAKAERDMLKREVAKLKKGNG